MKNKLLLRLRNFFLGPVMQEFLEVEQLICDLRDLSFIDRYRHLVGHQVFVRIFFESTRIESESVRGKLESVAQTIDLNDLGEPVQKNYFLVRNEHGKTRIILDQPETFVLDQGKDL